MGEDGKLFGRRQTDLQPVCIGLGEINFSDEAEAGEDDVNGLAGFRVEALRAVRGALADAGLIPQQADNVGCLHLFRLGNFTRCLM